MFYALPQDTLRIPVEGNITQELYGAAYMALATNASPEIVPLLDLMRFDIDRYSRVLIAQVPLPAENVSGIDCMNATAELPVITLVESDTTGIVAADHCIQIETQPNDLFLIRDRLLFSILGILDR